MFARFFWSTKEEGRSRHWASWQNLCLPKEEGRLGGLGFRSLFDVSKSLFAKLWWRFRTTKSLWSNFMWNKYFKKKIPKTVQFRGGSHIWSQMLNARQEVEHEIWWEMKDGTTNILHENWTGLRALYHFLPPNFHINEELQEVVQLRQDSGWNEELIEQKFSEDIADHIKFTVGSACHLVRHRANVNPEIRNMWVKGIPGGKGMVEFFLMPEVETFVSSNTCNHNLGAMEDEEHQQEWRSSTRYNWLPHMPPLWPDIIRCLEGYKPIMVTKRVTWQVPHNGWYKCNTDEASRGNPGPSSIVFCVRNSEENLVYARATNIVAEAKAIRDGLHYYVKHDLHPLIIETDSLVMRKIIYRWGMGSSMVCSTLQFYSFSELPSAEKRLLNLDKSQVPNLRVRISKRKAVD
uniref:RNase H type-1 domain-containing protein n=1 Tax=Nicotiana tabacum TaxID=4097 RepID=A0A1S3Y0M4_TOBAC|nr:PREDICTED: uncharacterized protein LOC107770706 [Nicotiana tabacum]